MVQSSFHPLYLLHLLELTLSLLRLSSGYLLVPISGVNHLTNHLYFILPAVSTKYLDAGFFEWNRFLISDVDFGTPNHHYQEYCVD
jgi:hypothetical protein